MRKIVLKPRWVVMKKVGRHWEEWDFDLNSEKKGLLLLKRSYRGQRNDNQTYKLFRVDTKEVEEP